ncbi:hypothetical protein, partial [Actinomadura fibrosa]
GAGAARATAQEPGGAARPVAYVHGGGVPDGLARRVKALEELPVTDTNVGIVLGLATGMVGTAFAATRLRRARRRED